MMFGLAALHRLADEGDIRGRDFLFRRGSGFGVEGEEHLAGGLRHG
jgi:hypothetical protein